MKRIALFAALIVGLLGTSAATCQKTEPKTPTDYVVNGVVECAKAGVHEVAINIIDDVASALATGDYMTGLLNLVKQFGEGAVDCAVAEVGDTAGKHAAMNELEATKAKRAKEWLASRPVKVSEVSKNGGGCSNPAARVGVLPPEGPAADAQLAATGADQPVVFLAGICPSRCIYGGGFS